MKILIAFILIFFSSIVNQNTYSSKYYARNYIVLDYHSQEVLEGKNYHQSYSVASISKIMTAIIALESDRLFDVIVVDDIIYEVEGSSIYLQEGDQITILDLVYGLLLRSGNDAAMLIANNVCDSVDEFVDLMNQKKEMLQLENTIFHNPSGLDISDEGNISSCFDMAKLMSYCLNNELFCQIINTKSYYSPLKGNWINKNKLLHNYEYCIGGKTGYTKKARRTLITVSEKDYQKLIIVTFDSPNDFSFHKDRYEFYFNNYRYLVFLVKGKNYIDEYYIFSEKLVGLRIDKNILKGTKVYYINPINNSLKIKFISLEKTYEIDEEFPIIYHK